MADRKNPESKQESDQGRKAMTAGRDDPWLMRTYSGHSSAEASNALYRTNLARGQTGLSVAFDLPTQTGYDADHPLARGEVGKVGVPIAHLGDMRSLFLDLPLDQMNTSMTINATAPCFWRFIALWPMSGGLIGRSFPAPCKMISSRNIFRAGPISFPPIPPAADQ
ncbi:hypothetical protein JCM17846_31650 [Iodidimonas nitroreducens]|uniref:Methylmalonyl-CoA mutase alpha/beta chain catalytic domain-containing protein n=1 Tax=Iodidimonas nitroreducens TaxID=1236968 RepID=A0A5A7NAQ8_9PROT|nr:hypothetical protein JCM17846_31650 [Iodidimonas nitroreducens]